MQIFVQCHYLTDGSKVCNLELGNVTLHAITETDAAELARKILEAVSLHTVDELGLTFND